MARTVISYGASVRGPLHQREGAPNQDAWLRGSGRFGSFIVVCDGLGSRPEGRLGARCACTVAREAVSKWAEAGGAPTSYLAHLIEVLWRIRIYPCDPKDAATTCLIAIACRNGQWVVGGVGDGLAAVRTGDARVVRLVGDRNAGFGNETYALGTSPGPKAWKLSVLPPTPLERVVVLATDGVADDLVPEKLDEFCKWLVGDLQKLDPNLRWRRLVAELRDWPTPRHLDDKTIAVLKTSAETSEEMT
jgi:serine/threonine protein phosphatase PrpC